MPKSAFGSSLVIGILGCSTPRPVPASAPDNIDLVGKDLAQIKETLQHLDNRLGHLESEVSASSAENELAEMTIDSVRWSDPRLGSEPAADEPVLLCHVKEWRGFGKMLRFTRKADRAFTLEAEGQPALDAYIDVGGICNSDGSIRYVLLRLTGQLAPDAAYRLRPHNGDEQYRWSVSNDLIVMAPDGGQ